METTIVIVYWCYIGIMEKNMETPIVYWCYIGIMEKNMETTIVYWGFIGIMEKKMETTIVWDNGKENGNHCRLLSFCLSPKP